MIYAALGIIIVLLIVIIVQHNRIKASTANIVYIREKIREIVGSSSDENVQVFTDDVQLQAFLSAVNELLELNRSNHVKNIRYQEAMRKMLANISHDLKTPLTVINGYIETLIVSEALSEDKQQQLLNKVHDKSKELIVLINQFFDLAKLESKDIVLPLSRVNINEVCRHVVLSYYEIIQSRNLHADIQIPEDDCYIQGNEEAIERCLDNLINNAMDYGREGEMIGVKVYTDVGYVIVEVWDKGKGILEKYHDEVFERLYTLEDSRNKHYQGSGLGLTITKRLVEQMKGTILLRSTAFVKTSFSMRFHKIS